jgi:hypothetical protein
MGAIVSRVSTLAAVALLSLAAAATAMGDTGDTIDAIRGKKPPARPGSTAAKPGPPTIGKKPAAKKHVAIHQAPPASQSTKSAGKPAPASMAATATSHPATDRLEELLARGRVGWWPAEQDARDVVAGNDGHITRGVTSVPGVKGLAWHFDGSRSGIILRDTPALAFTGAFTIALWFKAERLPGPDLYASQLFFRGDDRVGLDPYSLTIQPNGKVAFIIDSGKGGDIALSPDKAPVGKWTHLLGEFDPDRKLLRLYVDGKLVGEKKTLFSPMGPLEPAQKPGIGIGNTQDPEAYNQPFIGAIDDVQVWNRALTTKEAAYLARQSP